MPEDHTLQNDLFQQIKKNKLQCASMLQTVTFMEIMKRDHKFIKQAITLAL
jgi:hypothetical protein